MLDAFSNMFKLSFAISTDDVYSYYQIHNVITLEKPISWVYTFGNMTDYIDNQRKLLIEIEFNPNTKDFMPLRPI